MISIRDFSYDNPIRRVFNQPSGSPTLTSEPLLKFFSPSLAPSEGSDMLLGETNSLDPYNDNSLKLKAFCCDTEEINSGSTTSLTDASPTSDDILEEFTDELTHFSFTPEIDYQPFDVKADHRELEYLLNRDPTKDMVSIFKDSADSTIDEMFTDEHALDYSSPSIWDDYNDDLSDLETVIYDTYDDLDYDDPFDSKEEKIKESKLLIDYLDDLDSSESSDFLPFPKYDSFFHKDFSEGDALPSTVVEDKVFNPGIPIHEDLNVTKDKSSKEMFSSKSLDVFDPPAPPLMDHDSTLVIPGSKISLLVSSSTEDKIFKPGIQITKGIHSPSVLSHQGSQLFKILKIFQSLMQIFPCLVWGKIRISDVLFSYFYPP
ncbi:hypothetical protein Tco_0598262 [Tanacetum coccineum]